MRIKHTLCRTFLLTTTFCALSSCQTTQTSPGKSRFDKADTNRDGKVSRSEYSDSIVTTIFESRDANKDKKMTWKEWNVENNKEQRKGFIERDTNKDGIVSLDEALAHGRKHGVFNDAFAEADTNKDGSLTFKEASAYYASKEGPLN